MKRILAITVAMALIATTGCETKSGTASSTNPNKPNETRSVRITATENHTITQGETNDMTVAVTRSHDKDDLTLEVSDLPQGVTLDSKDLTVPGDKNTFTLRLKADPAAPPVEHHEFHIVGKAKDLQTDKLNVKLTVKAKK
jgi:hypothetical protein